VQIAIADAPCSDWDKKLPSLEGATFCHLSGWAAVMQEALGHTYHLITARSRGGDLLGGLPLVRMRSMVFGHQLVSMPFLNYGGAAGPESVRTALTLRAREFAEETGANRLVLRRQLGDSSDLPSGREKVMVRLQLGDDAEVLWKDHLKGKVRSQVRRPRKEGMTCGIGREHLESFYTVFAENMRDLGTPVHGFRLFSSLVDQFPEEVLVGAVYHEGAPVAGGFGFLWQGEFEMTWASSLRSVNRFSPNMLLYWSFMEETISRGGRLFNFGRSTPGTGTHRFKLQWGGEDAPLPWAEWQRGGTGEAGSGDPGSKLAFATRVWQKLPLPVANRLGPVLARRIPTF
jgi:FemAB-related protein (PEP-CTERM system-associated)